MTMASTAANPPVPLGRRIKRFMSDYPVIPLIILLIVLVGILQFIRPGIVNERWIANTIKFAIPLALLAGCQTMTMLTGGIDMSVGTVATISAFVMATQVVSIDPASAILMSLVPAVLIGAVNGIGVGIFRVHPLVMTLGTGLVGFGCLQVYQRTVIATGSDIPEFLAWLGTGLTWGVPNALLLFVPIAALILYTLRYTGFGRLLYAVGDNERAARLSGVSYWKVIVTLYIVSAVFGLSQGGIVPSYALIVREYFPAREAASRVSLVLMATIVGMALGGWLSGAIYDWTGSYQVAFWNGIAWNLVNTAIALFLLFHRWKQDIPVTARG